MSRLSYFVLYEGEAENKEAFLSYCRHRHVPILRQFPGIRSLVLHIPVPWQDPSPTKPDRFVLIAQMGFASQENLEKALGSEARAAARDDSGRFPPLHGLVYHQAMLPEEVFQNDGRSGNGR